MSSWQWWERDWMGEETGNRHGTQTNYRENGWAKNQAGNGRKK